MFFDDSGRSRARRRGVVLILILGMLALMALIGVTFATFAGQSLVNTRNYAAGVNWPGSEELMDYALAQLINDTNNPMSAIRGHSLLRDMYGNDSVIATGRYDQFRTNGVASQGGSGSATRGLLTGLPGGGALVFTNTQVHPTDTTKAFDFTGYTQYLTNIPIAGLPGLYGVDFTRWTVRMAATSNSVPTTYEVLEDDNSGNTAFSQVGSVAFHVFTLAPVDPTDSRSIGAANPIHVTQVYSPNTFETTAGAYTGSPTYLTQPILNSAFVLDGRYMRAFNGPGMSAFNFAGFDTTATPPSSGFNGAGQPHNNAAFANFRTSGGLLGLATTAGFTAANPPPLPGSGVTTATLPVTTSFGDPNNFGMDEDYDACDLENWFLALQSADGSVMIPSFHRPGILTASDWSNAFAATNTAAQNAAAVMSVSKILRPRSIDNYGPSFPPDPLPNASGKITYDVDNDGDGVSDSVWLDLGYPVLRDPRGQTFKPLFAFMVLGLNGRLPLNTAGNLQARDPQRPIYNSSNGFTAYYPQNLTDGAIWSHASHLGYSVNEINPMYALQNAPNLVYGQSALTSGATTTPSFGTLSLYTQFDNSGYDATNYPAGNGDYNGTAPLGNSMNRILGNVAVIDGGGSGNYLVNAGVGVDVTQMRNLLAGTVPQDNIQNPSGMNQDLNFVKVNGQNWHMPNGMYDAGDGVTTPSSGGSYVSRTGLSAVPGRWGEPQAIPLVLDQLPYTKVIPSAAAPVFTSVYPIYTNPVRSGKSAQWLTGYVFTTSGDYMDDDNDSHDAAAGEGSTAYKSGPPYAYATAGPPVTPAAADPVTGTSGDFYDGSNSLMLPVEWIRRFVTPIDPSANGRIVSWTDGAPVNQYDFGNGADQYGRVMFYRYFRPAGMPKALAYDATNLAAYYAAYDPTTAASSSFPAQLNDQQALNQPMAYGPILLPDFPTGTTAPTTATPTSTAPTYPPLPPPIWNLNTLPPAVAAGGNFDRFFDVTTNYLHGWQSQAAPLPYIGSNGTSITAATEATVSVAAAMPYDLVYPMNGINLPAGYTGTSYQIPMGATVTNFYPVLDPDNANTPITSTMSVVSATTLGINSGQGPVLSKLPNDPSGNPDQQNYQVLMNYGSTTAPQQYPTVVGAYPTWPNVRNGVPMPSDGLNKNEADEMNVYTPNPFDMPYGPGDLEWLYRLHDVDGAQLSSRLSKLAPISFTNPADALTRRRLFAIDSADTINYAFAPDNPHPIEYDYNSGIFVGADASAGSASIAASVYNSRFNPGVSASLAAINYYSIPLGGFPYQNNLAFTQYPNPVSYPFSSHESLVTGANFGTVAYPSTVPTVHQPPIVGPSVGSRDRKINLNYPLPVSNDPAEPVRQKWVREAYQLFKAILPPQAVDTPQELAQLSQFVVNIVDFRDPDCTATRFVNTDLMVIPATKTAVSQLAFADRAVPTSGSSPKQFVHYPFDPTIYDEQMRFYQPKFGTSMTATSPRVVPDSAAPQSDWFDAMIYPLGTMNPPSLGTAAQPANYVEFLVQHGMEYNPLALNEAVAYAYPNAGTTFTRLAVELANMLTDDGAVPAGKNGASDLTGAMLDGWDLVLTDDSEGYGRPDPVTGELPMTGLVAANGYPIAGAATGSQQMIISANNPIPGGPPQPSNIFTLSTPVKAIKDGTANHGGVNYFPISITFGTAPAVDTNPTGGLNLTSTIAGAANSSSSGGGSYGGTGPITQVAFDMPKTNAAAPAYLTAGQTMWCWMFLRRPANPFDQRPYAYREMVTVDAIRFPYFVTNATAANPAYAYSVERYQPFRGGHLVPPLPAVGTTTPTTNSFPLSPPPSNGLPTPYNPTAWGFAEQTSPGGSGRSTSGRGDSGNGNNQNGTGGSGTGGSGTGTSGNGQGTTTTAKVTYINGGATTNIYHSIGSKNDPIDRDWDYLAFNDRDFMSPAELLLVPGCPPGLFTKQFVEDNDPFDRNPTGDLQPGAVATPSPYSATSNPPETWGAPSSTVPWQGEGVFPNNVPRSYPYLVDKFYYSAAQVQPPATPPNDWTYPNLVGGWTGDGWYKMLEFVEVPSSANGAIGPVPNGNNFDWFRQDTKPGLLNLNLIIDEEVFFGLFDDPRLNDFLNSPSLGANAAGAPPTYLPQIVTQINAAGYPTTNGFYPISNLATLNLGPAIAGAAQSTWMTPQGRGYTDFNPDPNNANQPLEKHGIRAAFADFLKLRAGGSGFLFAWGTGTTGAGSASMTSGTGGSWAAYLNTYYNGLMPANQPINVTGGINTVGVARERPFRSFMAPDVNDTILRPATLPPTEFTTPVATFGPATGTPYGFAAYPAYTVTSGGNTYNYYGDPLSVSTAAPPTWPQLAGSPAGSDQYVGDQGIRNPFLAAPSYWPTANPLPANGGPNYFTRFAPPVPMRRFFQVSDANRTPDTNPSAGGSNPYFQSSGSAEFTLDQYNTAVANPDAMNGITFPHRLNQPIFLPDLFYPEWSASAGAAATTNSLSSNLFTAQHTVIQPGGNNGAGYGATNTVSHYLGVGLQNGTYTNGVITDSTGQMNNTGTGGGSDTGDNRQHPYFRTEMLQKVMNLTTVRTHQFAVWITIGFFEVLQQGSPSMGVPDVLGGEIGLASGRNIRYRSFFLLDRTRATGFDPYEPGDFRDVVTYRRRIE